MASAGIPLALRILFCALLISSTSLSAQVPARIASAQIHVLLSHENERANSFVTTITARYPGTSVSAQLPSERSDTGRMLVVAFGNGAVKLACGQDQFNQVIAIDVSSIDFATSNPGCKARAMTAIYADTSAAAQLELVKEIFGQAANVLVLSSELSVDTEKAISAAARSLGLNITIERTNASTPIFRLLTKHPNFDLVLAIPDRSIYQPETVRVLLEATYRRSKPMIGFNTSTVQAGMLAATYPSQEDVLETLDDLIARFNTKRELPTPKYVKHWRVAVNENVARSLSIAISDEAKSLGRSARSKTP
jgi:putative tryptophan/tyrosine transport system substrate-binding protein